MKKEYEEKKKRLDERYQARKERYVGGYKTVAPTSEPPVEEKVEEVVIEEVEEVVAEEETEEAKEVIPEEIEEEMKPEVQAPVEEDVVEPVLTIIEGIGHGRARKLEEAGIKTVSDLAGAMAVDIAKTVGVTIPTASELIKKAVAVSS